MRKKLDYIKLYRSLAMQFLLFFSFLSEEGAGRVCLSLHDGFNFFG
jgi:hypothetical protein